MTDHSSTPFVPTELWTPGTEVSGLDESIQRALYEMNQQNPGQLIDSLKRSVERSGSGVVYAMLKGENPSEYSDTEALVLFNPFANAATPNMLVRAEFIRRVAKYSNIRAADGKLKPVIMLASPGLGGSSFRLTEQELSEVEEGELGPVASRLLRTVSEKGIGRISLLGFSQGADIALAGARSAYSSNLDTDAVAIGDPAGVETRSRPELVGDFLEAGTNDLKRAVAATDLDAQKKAFGTGSVDLARFLISAIRPLNLSLYKGLGHDVFEQRVQEIIDEGLVERLVIGYGADSAISKPKKIEPALGRLYENYGRDAFISVRVDTGKHTWGDQLTLLAKLYIRAAS